MSLLDDRCFEVSSSQDLFYNRPTWYLNTCVPVSNWLLKMATSLQKHIHHHHCWAVMDGRWALGWATRRRERLALLSLFVTAAS